MKINDKTNHRILCILQNLDCRNSTNVKPFYCCVYVCTVHYFSSTVKTKNKIKVFKQIMACYANAGASVFEDKSIKITKYALRIVCTVYCSLI